MPPVSSTLFLDQLSQCPTVARKFEPEQIISVLTTHEVDFVLIGGMAAIARQSPYMTTDIDICPSKDAGNLQRLASALNALKARRITDLDPDGAKVKIDPGYLSQENEFAFMTDVGQLDIIFVPQGTSGYSDLTREATEESVFKEQVLIPSTIDVIRMKDARGLPKDRLVVDVLRKIMDREDEEH